MSVGSYDPNKASESFTKKVYFSIEKDQANVFRFLPPYGALATTNKIGHYWSIHFGFKGSNDKMKPIPCIFKKDRDGIVTQACPLCDKVTALGNALKTLKASGGNPAIVAELEAKLDKMNLDKAFYLNVVDASGKVGILQLRYKPFKALETEIKRLWNEEKVNAVSPGEGVMFDIRRTGMGRETQYSVNPARMTIQDPTSLKFYQMYKTFNVDDAIIARMEKEAGELTALYKIFGVEDLIAIASGDPKVIDRLFARPEKNDAAASDAEGADEEASSAATASQPAAQPVAQQQAVQPTGTVAPSQAPSSVSPNTSVPSSVSPSAAPASTVSAAPAPSTTIVAPNGVQLTISKEEEDLVNNFLKKS